MKTLSAVVFAILCAIPARAATITWFDSGFLDSVADDTSFPFPGLTSGTPWSVKVTFDPDAPGRPGFPSAPGGNCNIYSIGSTTFTLGGFSYASSGGQIWTNAALPGGGCTGVAGGEIQFEWSVEWTQEQGAWDLNGVNGLLIAGYSDAIAGDGSLPRVPTLSGFSSGLGFHQSMPFPLFQEYNFTPEALQAAPVPEPGTMMMFGVGLAYLARRRLRHTRPPTTPQ